MDKKFPFTLFFNFNAEDHYLVEYLSQYFRDKGLTTFDRSVNQLPDSPEFSISEDDALAQSEMMVAVLTQNSFEDPSFQNLVNRANAASKPVIVMRFDDAVIPSALTDKLVVDTERDHYVGGLETVEAALKELRVSAE